MAKQEMSRREWERHWEQQRERERVAVRERMRVYRERHKDDLSQARRVMVKLLTLRSTRKSWGTPSADQKIESVAESLLKFLTAEEAKKLSAALVGRGRKAKVRK
jgi:hypothetical protein